SELAVLVSLLSKHSLEPRAILPPPGWLNSGAALSQAGVTCLLPRPLPRHSTQILAAPAPLINCAESSGMARRLGWVILRTLARLRQRTGGARKWWGSLRDDAVGGPQRRASDPLGWPSRELVRGRVPGHVTCHLLGPPASKVRAASKSAMVARLNASI